MNDDPPPTGLVESYAHAGVVDSDRGETGLRPHSLSAFVGQPQVREQLQLILSAARMRGATPDHILMSGPPGLGKTSMAMIIARELGATLQLTSGPAIVRAGDLAAILSNLVEGDVLFIDEIHRIARPAEEMLYLAMEDLRVDVSSAKARGPRQSRWNSHRSPLSAPQLARAHSPGRCGIVSDSLPAWTSTIPPSSSRSSTDRRGSSM